VFLVVGLGNPGREHDNQRHNVGFAVVEAFARGIGASAFASKFAGRWARGDLAGRDVAILQPQTYMNGSGDSVQPAALFFKIPSVDVIVVHDEIDLPWQEVRLKLGGGHAGHNGLRSVLERLGTGDFVRVRVGIGRPRPPSIPPDAARPEPTVRDFVLSDFDPAERAALPGIIARAVEAIRLVVTEGIAAAQNACNARMNEKAGLPGKLC
jgi:PTH1 family peptidyl-tRNA hydrolase